MVGEQHVVVLILGDLGLVVAQRCRNAVGEGFAGHHVAVAPADGDFVALGAQVGAVLLGRGRSEDVGQRERRGEHVLGVADVEVGRDVEAVFEEAQIETEVVGYDRLPRKSVADGVRRRGVIGLFRAVEGVAQLAGRDRFDVVVVRHLLVAERAVREAHLGVVPPVAHRLPEFLLRDAPSGRCRGEEAPAVVGGEARRTVVACRHFEKVLAGVVVVRTGEITQRPVGRIRLDAAFDLALRHVDEAQLLAQRPFLADAQFRRAEVLEVAAGYGREVVLAPRVAVIEVGVDHMAVIVVAVLLIEVVDRTVGEIDHGGLRRVPCVGRRIGAVGSEVVAAAVGVVGVEFQILVACEVERHPVGDDVVVVLARVLVASVGEYAAASAGDRRVGELDAVGINERGAVGVDRNERRADVVGHVEEDAVGVELFGTVLLPVTAVFVVGHLHADVVRVVHPRRYFGGDLRAERVAVVDILGAMVEQAFTVEVAAADVVVDLVVAARERNVVLGFGTAALEHVVVPVEVAQIAVFAVAVGDDPRAVGMLGLVVAAVVEHLHLLVRVVPAHIAFRRVAEFVGEFHVVVSRRDEVGRGGVPRHAVAAVVVDFQRAGLTALGGDEHHAGRSLGAVDRAGRSVLEHRYRFDVVGVDLRQRRFDAVDEHQRAAAVERYRAADLDVVVLAFDRAAAEQQRRIGALQGGGRIGHGTVVEVLAADGAHGARDVHALLLAVADHDHLVDGCRALHEGNVDGGVGVDVDRPGLVADERDDELRRKLDVLQREVAVAHGRGAVVGAVHDDRGARNGQPQIVFHHAFELVLIRGETLRGGLGYGDAFARNRVGDVLIGEDLGQNLVDRRVLRRDADAALHVDAGRFDGHGVVLPLIEGFDGLLDRYIREFEVDRLCQSRAGKRQQAECEQTHDRTRMEKCGSIVKFFHRLKF